MSNQNIQFFFDEEDGDGDDKEQDETTSINLNNDNDFKDGNEITVNSLMMDFDELSLIDDQNAELMNFYNDNYNVKDLLKVCEYYGIIKEAQKCKKLGLIYNILLFENNDMNYEVVLKRKQLWHYMNELKQDKFMRRHILW
jgi:hypothetical protein